MTESETWLVEQLKSLTAKVGEPVTITIRLLPDEDLHLDLKTRSGRHGITYGTSDTWPHETILLANSL
ncbi:MAG: hypothetical protein R6X18_09660 [Chloroflexota bacterium]|jgi:hypothetical protein